jgi:hypothetical protein
MMPNDTTNGGQRECGVQRVPLVGAAIGARFMAHVCSTVGVLLLFQDFRRGIGCTRCRDGHVSIPWLFCYRMMNARLGNGINNTSRENLHPKKPHPSSGNENG